LLMVDTPARKDSEQPSNGNGHKPRVLVLSQDPHLNHLLESRLKLLEYEVNFIDNVEQLEAPDSKFHDVFVLCKLPSGTSELERLRMYSREMHFLQKLLLAKGERNEPFLAVVPLERDGDGFRYSVTENASAGAFDEPRRTIYRAFSAYQRLLDNQKVDLAQELLEDMVGSMSREAPKQHERPRPSSIDMLVHMVKETPDNPELYFALGKAYEANNAPVDALTAYQNTLLKQPAHQQALHALGGLLLQPQVAQKLRQKQILELLGILDVQEGSPDVDHYRNALYLAMGDNEALRKAIDISSRYENQPQLIDFYPTIIDACSRIAFRSRSPADSERLYHAIERFVNTVAKSEQFPDAAVGMRLVKKGTGRHVVFDVVPTTREGSMQSQHVYIKAFTPKQRKSAAIELENILALHSHHHGRLKTLYGEMLLPGFAVLAQKPDDERSTAYLVTPLLAGERSDRVLEHKSPDLRREYLARIMAGGVALQRALKDLGRAAAPEDDFYTRRFVEKVLGRIDAFKLTKPLTDTERLSAVDFYRKEINDPLLAVDEKLKLPYTGSHTLKNINIDENPPRSPEQEIKHSTSPRRGKQAVVDRSTIARYDIEDISDRFFVSDHALSIEDSAIGITDPSELKDWYDTLLLQFFASQPSAPKYLTADYIDQSAAKAKAGTISKLLRTKGIRCTREQYHDLVARVSLERHITFAFDRIKEIAQKTEQLRSLETRYKPLATYGKMLHDAIGREDDFNYEGLLNRLMQLRREHPQQSGWQQAFMYVSLHRDYETYLRSKNNHLARVKARMDQLWDKRPRDAGYRAFRKVIDAATAYK
jgi:hypothetical protein